MYNKVDVEKEIFLKTLCGKYSNQKQAYNNPKLFAHINIYFRILPWELFQCHSIYSEQSYDYSPWSPYRQAVQKVLNKKGKIILENYKILNSVRVAGAGENVKLLKGISIGNLLFRENCAMHFTKIHGD